MLERFWSKVNKSGTPEHPWCWVWMGRLSTKGYGETDIPSAGPRRFVSRRTHRVAYEALVEPVPDGLELDHLCRNRACCNPAHLEPVAHQENARRGMAGRSEKAKAVLAGILDRRRAMTHCKAGHELSGTNLLPTTARQYRRCRECARLHCVKQRERSRARAAA